MLEEALILCLEEKNCKNINDVLHMKLATQYAKLQQHTNIKIEVL